MKLIIKKCTLGLLYNTNISLIIIFNLKVTFIKQWIAENLDFLDEPALEIKKKFLASIKFKRETCQFSDSDLPVYIKTGLNI